MKYIFNFLKLINYLILIPFFFIIKLISPFFLIRWHELPTARIGHLAAETDLYFCEKEKLINSPNKFHIDLFFVGLKISNEHLLKMFSKKMIILPRFILSPLCRMSRELSKILKIKDIHEIGNNTSSCFDSLNLLDQTSPFIEFTNKELIYGEKIMREMNIPTNKKIVILVLRDKTYLLKEFPNKDFSYHDFRNYRYEAFVPAIKKLIDLGYFVIRIGKLVEKQFPLKSNNFLDYPFGKFKSDFMNVFLIHKCFFLISSGTGVQEIAKTFRKFLIQCEAILGSLPSSSKKHLLINKNFFNKKTNKKMTLREIINSGAHLFKTKQEYEKTNIVIQDNTEKEILDIVFEMHLKANNIKYYSEEDIELQNKFKEIYVKNLIPINKKIHGEFLANYSINYLKNNKDWLY